MIEKISSLLVRFRYLSVIVILLLTAFFASQVIPVEKMKFDFSFKKLLLKDGEDLDKLIEYKSEFGDDIGTIAILLKIEKGGGDGISNTVFLPENLKIIVEFTDFLLKRPEVDAEKVFSVTEATNLHSDPIKSKYVKGVLNEALEIEKRLGLNVSAEIEKFEAGGKKAHELNPEILAIFDKIKAARDGMLAHRLYKHTILSHDASAGSSVGIFDTDHIELASREPLIHEIVAMVEAKNRELPAGKSLYLTGVPPVETEYKKLSLKDIVLFTPITGFIIGIVMFIIFRSLLMTAIPLLVVLTAVVTTVGFMQWTGEAVNILNTVIPVIILVLGVSDSIHILYRYREELQKSYAKKEAVKRTFTAMILACLLTSATP
ncbi:MAG: MMPL family transporter, partial [Deltaproteobacteria bacterium]|nr:MMPL family transporter [Deltaproteobacteria bacterium]